MMKLWSATSLVALGLLGCLTWTNVEAQKKPFVQNTQRQNSASTFIRQSHDQQQWSKKRPNTPEIEISVCEVPSPHRVPCGDLGISLDGCQALDCCYDAEQCFFGNAATVHCTTDGFFLVVIPRGATQPGIDLDLLNLMGQGEYCRQEAYNLHFSIFRFPVSACGTEVWEDSGAIVYKNRLTCEHPYQTGPHGSITRSSHFELSFECKYTSTAVHYVNLELGLQDPPLNVHAEGPLRVQLKLANGVCSEKGCSGESHYNSFYGEGDYPISKVLRDPVYVEVELMNKEDPIAFLVLHRCWATAKSDPHTVPQWDILIDGCPNPDDPDSVQLVPMDYSRDDIVYEHYKRFMFHMFAFVNSGEESPSTQQVFIHCSTSVCLAIPGRICQQPCARKKRDVAERVAETPALRVVGTAGPVNIIQPDAKQ